MASMSLVMYSVVDQGCRSLEAYMSLHIYLHMYIKVVAVKKLVVGFRGNPVGPS